MKNYILPLLFSLQAVILLLCLLGFTLIKSPLLEHIENNRMEVGLSIDKPDPDLEGFSAEDLAFREKGESLFNALCSTCHLKSRKLVGPALKDVCSKYSKEGERAWLFKWIRNSQYLIQNEKDPKAIELWEKYDRKVMPSFVSLEDEEIEAMLEYLEPGCISHQDR